MYSWEMFELFKAAKVATGDVHETQFQEHFMKHEILS